MTQIETNVVKPEVKFIKNDVEYFILSNEGESRLDSNINSINEYMFHNNGKGKSSEEKDMLYKNSQDLWKDLANSLRETKYNFHLNRKQFNFLTDLLTKNLEYDVNTVFFAIELTELLGNMSTTKFKDDNEVLAFPVNATEITYIYHLISTHKPKGLTKNTYLFAEILMKIGEISKVFNYYDATAKNLSVEIQEWVASFEEGVSKEVPAEEVVEVKVLDGNN